MLKKQNNTYLMMNHCCDEMDDWIVRAGYHFGFPRDLTPHGICTRQPDVAYRVHGIACCLFWAVGFSVIDVVSGSASAPRFLLANFVQSSVINRMIISE